MVERLHVHCHDGRDARSHLSHVVDSHDDEPALGELGSAGVHDRDARPVALDRLGDGLVPDGVAGQVEVVEHEAADGRKQLGHPSRSVPRGRSRDPEPVPLERLHHRPRREAECTKRLLVLRLAEDWDVARKELLRPSVEVVAMPVRHENGVDPAHDLLGRERQGHGRGSATWFRVPSIGGRAPTSSSIGSTRIRRSASSRITVALRTRVSRTPGF